MVIQVRYRFREILSVDHLGMAQLVIFFLISTMLLTTNAILTQFDVQQHDQLMTPMPAKYGNSGIYGHRRIGYTKIMG